jgi:serine-type D-Ala-D-Ala carboxypeptidase/endopeptidase (penicillin-binding protein 4)
MFQVLSALVVFYCSVINAQSNNDLILEKALKSTGIKSKNLGIAVYDIKNKKQVYSFNSDKLFSIASVNKLLITGASLKYLGQDFRFKTIISGKTPNKDGIVKGDIYIKGNGDPLFVSENMWYLVNTLYNIGVRSIEGDIILDNTMFSAKNIYEEDGDRAYNSKVSALSVNFNSIAVNVVSGDVPHVSIDPKVSSIGLLDKTHNSPSKNDVEIRRISDDIVVSGNIDSREYSLKTTYRNIDDPVSYFKEVLLLHMSWRDMQLNGDVRSGKVSSREKVLFEMDSRRLNDILVEMNKFSNNFISEQLMRAFVYKLKGVVDEKAFSELMRDYVREIGLDPNSFEVVNASGFSRMNRTKPSDFVKFLASVYDDFQTGPEFINSLPISGIDGTIRRTHAGANVKGKIRAKTGTLSGVRSLAGYVSGERTVYAFIIVVNDPKANNMTNWESRILEKFITGEKDV